MSFLVAAAETAEETRDLPIPPWAVGALAFLALLVLLLALLSFGKGRDHT